MSGRHNQITFKVESDKEKGTFWYTLINGNGNTTMRSTKDDYADHATAKRAAQRQIDALLGTQLVLEYTDRKGHVVREPREVVVSAQSAGVNFVPVHPRNLQIRGS